MSQLQMREIKSHTSLRGIAAILVAYYHIDSIVSESIQASNVTLFIENSYALVDLFFVLSGFIMAYVYWKVFSKSIRKDDCIDFFISRFSRIYPLHIATLFFMVLLLGYSKGTSQLPSHFDEIIQNVFLIHAWGGTDTFIFNFPSWSVSVEMFAYLLFPFIVFSMGSSLGIATLTALVIAMYSYMFFELSTFHVDEKLSLIRGIPSFIIGVLIYRLKDVTSLLSNRLISISQTACLTLIIVLMHFTNNIFSLLIIFPVFVLSLWEDRGVLAKLLSNRYLVYLGTLSYSIYLLHIPIRNSMFFIFPKLNLSLSKPHEDVVFVIAVLLTTIISSTFIYHFFERPFRDGIKKYSRNIFLDGSYSLHQGVKVPVERRVEIE